MRFQVGDTVRIAKTARCYGDGQLNPKDINGKITRVGSGIVRVSWANGERNHYSENRLRLVKR